MKSSLSFLLAVVPLFANAEEAWRFINLADWHNAEKYVFADISNSQAVQSDITKLSAIKKSYGGELVVIPGDSNSGKWDQPKFIETFRPGGKAEDIILEAGALCYGGMIDSFRKAGYPKILMAIGDHELGDNPWPVNSVKARTQPQFRQAFAREFNLSGDGGRFRYPEKIGSVPSRPIGTKYEETSFALKHRNVLFLTLDAFRQESPGTRLGVEGSVTGEVVGPHLDWVDRVLTEARKDPEIKHIIAQSHLPILYPVRKVSSSGMLMDNNEDSELWKVLRKHSVDMYLAGEVHANTVTKDPQSDLLQVVTRGNGASNFQTVDITEDSIEMILYRIPDAIVIKGDYYEAGRLLIDKSGSQPRINATGDLSLLDRDQPMLHFTFEEELAFKDRPMNGTRLGVKNSNIPNGVTCTRIISNEGEFGNQYDAFYHDVEFVKGVQGKAGQFNSGSRMGVFGMGPLELHHPVSYAMWVKTTSTRDQILINTQTIWGNKPEVFLNLYLENGVPVGAISHSQNVVAEGVSINDGEWHHLALVVPHAHTRLSELQMYVDGEPVPTNLRGDDRIISLNRHMRLNIGCKGYSPKKIEHMNYDGELDDVMLWTRPIKVAEIQRLLHK
ncbi:MAG: LamG-like jellyroll fold domain-containing protein [Puniceicoccaceae bacterium]